MAYGDSDEDLDPTTDEGIVKEAQRRFKRCQDWEGTAQARWRDDVMFSEGDSDNLWQWPEDMREPNDPEGGSEIMLTVNKTRQHVLDVLNDARQSKVGVRIIPTGDEATYESAQAYMGFVRAIEYRSNAQAAYQHGLRHAVQGGIGYWRILTQYVHDDTFDQEIVVRRVLNPLLIYLDPDINELDGSDAKFGFVTDLIPKEEFDRRFPKLKDRARDSTLGSDVAWVGDSHVRVAEYWRRVPTEDVLLGYMNPATSQRVIERASSLPPEMRRALLADDATLTRKITTWDVECYTIVGNAIADRDEWPGVYIPIVRVIGEETVIDGQMDRKGHTRHLKDGQRMLNWNCSAFIKHGALQTKTPFTGPIEAIEGFEEYWNSANTEDRSFLPYNGLDELGNKIDRPQREPAPQGAPAFLAGMQWAVQWMEMASGQYPADFGAPGNERSGVAINERRREGDNATYHYLDHQSAAIMFTGKIFIDLIPKVYDTPRLLHYKDEANTEHQIKIDPHQQEAVTQEQMEGEDKKLTIFNPKVGRYEVEADVGKSYATARQEAFDAGMEILTKRPELAAIIGDLILTNADFPTADEMARRLKRGVPPQYLENDQNPQVAAMEEQMAGLGEMLKAMAAKLDSKAEETRLADEKNAIAGYNATTARIAAVKEALGLDSAGLAALIREVIAEAAAQSDSGAALAGALDVPQTYDEMPETVPQAMGGPAIDGAPPEPAAPGGGA